MRYEVRFAPKAEGQFLKLPPAARRRLQPALERLADDPRPPGVTKLAGTRHLMRLRVGKYRVAYEVRDEVLLVLIAAVAHRKNVYDQL